jgi:hypothetical protein
MYFVSARRDHRFVAVGSALITLVVFAALALASRAQASELLYWNNYGSDNVGVANIDGSGGGLVNLGAGKLTSPEGMAYDTASNRLFVANEEGANGQILAVNLDGSGAVPFTAPGAPIEEPEGVAVDPSRGMIFWENVDSNTISWAKLDGSAGGVLNTTGTTLSGICCRIAIDPVGGRVYWVNGTPSPNTIGFANLDNTGGGGELNLTGTTVEPGGEGLAVDNATGRLYFLGGSYEIGYANLNGSGGGDVPTGAGVISSPWGIAFDPSIARLYWANEGNSGPGAQTNAFGFTSVSGGASGNISIAATPVDSPQDPVIIKSPTGAGAPTVTRDKKTPSKLTCSQGTWAADYAGSFVYQAPRTYAYAWTRNGTPVAGATQATLNVKSAGKYACTVTASNQAGSAAQASGATNVKAAKVKLTTKKKVHAKPGGIAKFKVKAKNQGDLKAKNAKVCVKLPKAAKGALMAPKCKSLGGLKGRGKKSATLKIKVLPSAGGTYKVTFQVKGTGGKAAKAKIIVS